MNEGTDEIIKDATLVYTDGISEWFEAIHLTEKGVVIDRIMNGKPVSCGFISKRNIKEIKVKGKRISFYSEKYIKEEPTLWDSRNILKEEKNEKENRRNGSFNAGSHCGGVCDRYQRQKR
jgi:hypothetical protein